MKILRFGDPHVKNGNLEESERLLQLVYDTGFKWQIDRLEIEGDLFDTHSIVHLKVMEFWQKWLEILAINPHFQTVVLTGNHDISGDLGSNYSALTVFRALESSEGSALSIIKNPVAFGKFAYLPYIHDNDRFVKEANRLAQDEGATVLVSHTTYAGSQYDNGMYAPNGVDPALLDSRFLHLISGHVHTEQEFGRVWYPGTARWATISDANKRKGIWVCTHDDVTGGLISRDFISTERVCVPIISAVYLEGSELPGPFPMGARVNLQLIGSSDWVAKMKNEFKGEYLLSSKITDSKKSKVRKSGKSLHEFLLNHYDTKNREKLITYMQGLGLV